MPSVVQSLCQAPEFTVVFEWNHWPAQKKVFLLCKKVRKEVVLWSRSSARRPLCIMCCQSDDFLKTLWSLTKFKNLTNSCINYFFVVNYCLHDNYISSYLVVVVVLGKVLWFWNLDMCTISHAINRQHSIPGLEIKHNFLMLASVLHSCTWRL